jgi:exodeoxyribonuclease VII large subunit
MHHAISQANTLRHARVDRLQARLGAQHPRLRLAPVGLRIAELRQRLATGMARRMERDRLRVQQQGRTLHAVSPLATLERGYAIVFDERDAVVRRSGDIAIGERVRVMLAEGQMHLVREE